MADEPMFEVLCPSCETHLFLDTQQAELQRLRAIEEAVREAPMLRDETLQEIGNEIIVATGNGELAAHVVKWLRKMANLRTVLDADTGGRDDVE